MKKNLPVLFKHTSKGQIQQWQVCVNENAFYTKEGILDGKITISKPTLCTGKNIGKKNETSPNEQAIIEAHSKYQKKLDKGYAEILGEGVTFFEPMLAHSIEDHKDLLFTVRTFIQPKMDGLACIAQNNSLASRNGKPYVSCPHLHQNGVILHGELYNREYSDNFNKIVSLCKKQKPTNEEIEEAREKVELWVYDFPSSADKVFSERYKDLSEWYEENKDRGFVLVPTHEVFSMEDIEKWDEKFLSDGYEGSIIRLDLGAYENKRSRQVLKKKSFKDEEFLIVGVTPGEGGRTGTVGKFTMDLGDGTGRTFDTNVKGSHEYLADLLKRKEELIGKTATVKYFMLTPAGIPRFPYVIKIAREEFE